MTREPIVRTVLGDMDPSKLGFTLPHEHVIQDHFPVWGDPDLTIKDEEEMAQELTLAAQAGIRAIGEMSTVDTNHDLEALARISQTSGVQIIGSTGWFYGQHLPELVRDGEVAQLAEIMERDILEGTPGRNIRAGVIGEIGTSANEMLDPERKVFEAAAATHSRTGAPVYTHTTDGTLGPEQLDFLAARNVDPSRIAVSHMDTNPLFDYQLEVARRGAFLSYDRIGATRPGAMKDEQRADFIARLIDEGHLRQILLCQDTAHLSQLHGRGGRGYAYLVNSFLPLLRSTGIDPESIRIMTEENPRSFFAFSPSRR